MESFDKSRDIESIVEYPARIMHADGEIDVGARELQAEHTLDVFVEGKLAMRIVCTPTNLVELVMGRLFTEGFIDSADDIEMMYLCELSTKARVLFADKGRRLADRAVPIVQTCCTGNRVYAAVERADGDGSALSSVRPIAWDPSWMFNLARAFAEDTPMHRRTFGAHSCLLAQGDEILYCCEDLGRHNAFDKVVGCALRDGVDLRQAIVCTSGRLPVDMVVKAIRAQVPILVSKAVPTDLTVELARRFDLTLVCCARPDSVMVFHDPSNPIEPSDHARQWKVPRLFDVDLL